jgi:hypothetical protein
MRVRRVAPYLAADPLTPRPPLPQGGEGEKEIFRRGIDSLVIRPSV